MRAGYFYTQDHSLTQIKTKINKKHRGYNGCDDSPTTIKDNLKLSVREKRIPSDAGPKLSVHVSS